MHDVKLLLKDEAVFANEVEGTRWVRAVDGQGQWMERAAVLKDISRQLVGPALRTTDINPTVTLGEFLQAARRLPGGDVVHVIIYVPTAQLPRCYDSVVAGLVRLKVTSPRTAASTVAAGTVDHHDANQFGDATLPVSVAGYFDKDVYRRYADAVVVNMLKDEYAKSREEERQLRVSLVGSPGVGKSTLIQLLCSELMAESVEVFYLHRVGCGDVVLKFFASTGHVICGRVAESSVQELLDILSLIEGRELSPIVILDGFSLSPLPMNARFNIFVTSGGFNDPGLGSNMILLPSWSK